MNICVGVFRSVLWIIPLLAAPVILSDRAAAQQSPENPTEYWVLFQKNFRESPEQKDIEAFDSLSLELLIAADTVVHGRVEIPALGTIEEFTVPKGGSITIPVASGLRIRTSALVDSLGIHVTADGPITLHGISRRRRTAETFLAYPLSALGRRYRVAGYATSSREMVSQAAVVATEDSTHLRIVPTDSTCSIRLMKHPRSAGGRTGMPDAERQAIAQRKRERAGRRNINLDSLKAARTSERRTSVFNFPDSSKGILITRVHGAEETKKRQPPLPRGLELVAPYPDSVRSDSSGTFAMQFRILSRDTIRGFKAWYAASGSAPDRISYASYRRDPSRFQEPASLEEVIGPGYGAGDTIDVILNRGETYQIIAAHDGRVDYDLTGTLMEADKPIALFSGRNCGSVPESGPVDCNLIVEQIPPVESWGFRFFSAPPGHETKAVVRVTASEPETVIYRNERPVDTLDAGASLDVEIAGPTAIRGGKPIMAVQCTGTPASGDSIGSPAMVVVPPVEHFVRAARIVFPCDGEWEHSLTVMVPGDGLGMLRLDDQSVDTGHFQMVNETYAVGSLPMNCGAYSITCSLPFGLLGYGHRAGDSGMQAYGTVGIHPVVPSTVEP